MSLVKSISKGLLLCLVIVGLAACSKDKREVKGQAPSGEELPASMVITGVKDVKWSGNAKAYVESKGIHTTFNCVRWLDYRNGNVSGVKVALVKDPSCMNTNEPRREDIAATFDVQETQFGIMKLNVYGPEYPIGQLNATVNQNSEILYWSITELCTGSYQACEIEGTSSGMIGEVDIY